MRITNLIILMGVFSSLAWADETIHAEGSCPSAPAVAAELARLLPAPPTVPRPSVEIVDDGEVYRVTIADRVRVFADSDRRCEERAKTAALFIALTFEPANFQAGDDTLGPIAPAPRPVVAPAPAASAAATSPAPQSRKSFQRFFVGGGFHLNAGPSGHDWLAGSYGPLYGGLGHDIGYEYTSPSGLLLGVRTIALGEFGGNSFVGGVERSNGGVALQIGYGAPRFSLSLSVAGGWPYFAAAGFALRIGRFDGSYFLLRYLTGVLPFSWAFIYGSDGEVELHIELPSLEHRIAFKIVRRGVFDLFATGGYEHLFSGDGMKNTNLLFVDAGVSTWQFVTVGPIVWIGYERRW